MAKTIINADTFTAARTEDFYGKPREVGTVECTLGRETRTVEAFRYEGGNIVTFAFTGRYLTGKKAWPASVSLDGDRETIWYGKDHTARSCTKTGLSWK